MSWIKDYRDAVNERIRKEEDIENEVTAPEEEWVWINGFKGTDKDMVCHNYQYEMKKMFEMPAGVEISLCSSGFHLCKELKDVFRYYDIKHNNRFFEVKALVRAVDTACCEKMVAKAIFFTRELGADEILNAAVSKMTTWERVNINLDKWSEEQKKRALSVGLREAYGDFLTDKLVACGYSKPFAAHIIYMGGYDVACAVGTQEDLSMDLKAMYIYQAIMMQSQDPRGTRKPAYRRF